MKTKTYEKNKEHAQMLATQLSKLRHWMEGYEAGSGKLIHNKMALVMAQSFIEELFEVHS